MLLHPSRALPKPIGTTRVSATRSKLRNVGVGGGEAPPPKPLLFLTFSCAHHVRTSVSSGCLTFRTRAHTLFLRCRQRPPIASHPSFGVAATPPLIAIGPYWITCVVCPRTDCGIVRPRARAVVRLTTKSNFVGCSIGRSPGLAPFRILSTRVAERRYESTISGPRDSRPRRPPSPCSPSSSGAGA